MWLHPIHGIKWIVQREDAHRLTDADELFTEMAERGVFPDLYTLTTLIRCRCKNGE
jgi:hypothetical protein